MTVYARPGAQGSLMTFASRYENFIGGQWVPPEHGRYFENRTPVTGRCSARYHARMKPMWRRRLTRRMPRRPAGPSSPADRALILNRVADRMEANLEAIAVAESWDNGKPIRETVNADVPLAIDHFRYFAGVLRAQEGSLADR